MNWPIYYGILCLVCIGTATPASLPEHKEQLQNKEQQPLKLRVVARADGKTFFADETKRSWSAAKDYCQSQGMQLASITSSSQMAALHNAAEPGVFYSHYWTSGRDSQQISQFQWDSANSAVRSDQITFRAWAFVDFKTCLVLKPYEPPNASFVFYYQCSEPLGVLCES